jgi:hypothetical protein
MIHFFYPMLIVMSFFCLTSTENQNVTTKLTTPAPVFATTVADKVTNRTDVTSNELTHTGFTSFLENEELVAAGREGLRVFVKALKSNRTLDEAFTIAVTAYATTRTAREIRGSLKNAKFALDRDFGEQRPRFRVSRSYISSLFRSADFSKSMGFITLGSLAILPPLIFPKFFRSMDESWLAENRQIQKFFTGTLVEASE